MKPIYPKGFVTPSGRYISVRTMANALRELRKMNPTDDVPGWDWHPVWAAHIRKEVQRGIHERINRRVQ